MRNLQIFENFKGDYDKIVSDWKNYTKNYKKSKLDLWSQYRQTFVDIFQEMEDYKENFYIDDIDDYSEDFKTYVEFLDYIFDFSTDPNIPFYLSEHTFGYSIMNNYWFDEKDDDFKRPQSFEKTSSGRLKFDVENEIINLSEVEEFIFKSVEFTKKFNMIKDSFSMSLKFTIMRESLIIGRFELTNADKMDEDNIFDGSSFREWLRKIYDLYNIDPSDPQYLPTSTKNSYGSTPLKLGRKSIFAEFELGLV